MSEEGILKKIDDIWNYCEEIDNHLPKEEKTGYKMLPDILYIRKEVYNLQQKVEQLEKVLTYLEKYFSFKEDYEYSELVRQVKESNIEWLEKGIKNYE